MELVILFDHRFRRTPSGVVCSPTAYSYEFFRNRYLDIFDSVSVMARVERADAHDDVRATEGRGVRVIDLGNWTGAAGYIRARSRVIRETQEMMRRKAACLLMVPGGVASLAFPILERAHYPYVVEVLGDPWDAYSPRAIRHPLRPALRRWFFHGLQRQCAQADAALYVTSHALQERYPCGGLGAGISDVVLPPAAYASSPRSCVSPSISIVTVGSMAHGYKGHDLLLHAVQMCVARGLDARLVLVGDGQYRRELERQVQAAGLDGRVRFAGHVCPASAVREELDAADLFVLPSRQEGLPRALVEAMARGLPCLATRVGGIPELLAADDLVEPNDPQALADAIMAAATDRQRMAMMSERNLQKAAEFEEQALVRARAQFYRQVRSNLESRDQSSTLLHIATISATLGFILRQMKFMRDRGWQVHTMASAGKYAAVLKHQEIPFHPVEMQRRVTPFRDLIAIFRLCRKIRRIRPMLIHAHTPKAGLLGMIAAKLMRVPLRVFHVHGLPHLSARGVKYRLLVLATKVTCRLAQIVFCVSPSIRQVLIEERLCPADKVKVPMHGSSGGVDAQNLFNPNRFTRETPTAVRARYGVPADAFTVAFAGRLVRDKGLIELCAAWESLRSRHPGLHLLIAGDFEPQDPVPAEVVQRLKSDPRVRLVGFCTNMPEFLYAVDLVVFPSYREGFGNVPLEAAAMCRPIVATAIPGCRDSVVDGMTGTLVPPRDAAALTDAMERYIQDPELRREHGAKGRERALRDFRAEAIWEFIYREYVDLLQQRGLSGPERVSQTVKTEVCTQ